MQEIICPACGSSTSQRFCGSCGMQLQGTSFQVAPSHQQYELIQRSLRQRRRRRILITLTILIFIPIFIYACLKTLYDLSNTPMSVEYRVEGSDGAQFANLTYENGGGGSSQESDVYLWPAWKKTFTGRLGDFVYISAQNQGRSGKITVSILRNGIVIKQSTSSGAYAVATASDSL